MVSSHLVKKRDKPDHSSFLKLGRYDYRMAFGITRYGFTSAITIISSLATFLLSPQVIAEPAVTAPLSACVTFFSKLGLWRPKPVPQVYEFDFIDGSQGRSVLRELARKIESGAVDEIYTGVIIGPKIPNLITKVSDLIPADKKILVKGDFNVARLFRRLDQYRANPDRPPPYNWSPLDEKDFETAIEKMKVKDACRKFYKTDDFSQCGFLVFEFDSSAPEKIKWSRSPRD